MVQHPDNILWTRENLMIFEENRGYTVLDWKYESVFLAYESNNIRHNKQ